MSSRLSFSNLVKIGLVFASGSLWLTTGACSDEGTDDGGTGGVAATGGSTSTGGSTTVSACLNYDTESHEGNATCGTNCAACHTDTTCTCATMSVTACTAGTVAGSCS